MNVGTVLIGPDTVPDIEKYCGPRLEITKFCFGSSTGAGDNGGTFMMNDAEREPDIMTRALDTLRAARGSGDEEIDGWGGDEEMDG